MLCRWACSSFLERLHLKMHTAADCREHGLQHQPGNQLTQRTQQSRAHRVHVTAAAASMGLSCWACSSLSLTASFGHDSHGISSLPHWTPDSRRAPHLCVLTTTQGVMDRFTAARSLTMNLHGHHT